ncbi:MAG: substrate-binding domain-containing protein [Planctomycetota bacterium]|jgi:ribose transport system substrate-binding protein|nr:substrate-binding domain-containing protein [Planctomycetota bacterium]
MERLFKTVLLAVLFIGLAMVVHAAEKKLVVAIVPVALNNPIFVDALDSASVAGSELGVEILKNAPSNPDAAEQVKVVEGLIERKVDGILLFPVDSKALKGVVDRAVDRGIVVGILNSDIPDSRRAFYYGTDNYTLGKQCGEKMVEIMGGKGSVAVQTGVIGMDALDQRVNGFRDAIKGTGITEVAFQANDDSSEKSIELINTYLSANSNLDGYFITGGWPFFAPPESLPELAKFRRRGGKFGIVDTFYPMFQYLDRPEPLVDFMIGQDYVAMGRNGVRMIVDILRGGKVKDVISYSPLEYCDQNNMKEILAAKSAW